MALVRNRLAYGLAVEERALDWLKSQPTRFRVVTRNYRWRGGELDLILEEGDELLELVVIEVRCRGPASWVSAIDSVSFPKQRRLVRTIQHYLARYDGPAYGVRFDVVTWDGSSWERFRNVLLPDLTR